VSSTALSVPSGDKLSPCYIYDGDYRGGFSLKDIDSLPQMLESNYFPRRRLSSPSAESAQLSLRQHRGVGVVQSSLPRS